MSAVLGRLEVMPETTRRALRVLSVLTARRTVSGSELAADLGVSTRTVRRDIDRLRELGYPIEGEHGSGGGYRLGAGHRLPPLVLEDDEAVAIAVGLQLAAGSPVQGLADSVVRTTAKLDQVLPARLRSEVLALQAVTVLPAIAAAVEPQAQLTAVHSAREHVRLRFSYTARGGQPSDRDIEPYHVLATGNLWYVIGFDLDRQDWRSFWIDRMTQVRASTFRFKARPTPDPAELIRPSGPAGFPVTAVVRFDVPAEAVRRRVPAVFGTVTALDDHHCELLAGSDNVDDLAWHLSWVARDLNATLTVVDAPGLQPAMRRLGTLMRRHGGARR